MLLVASVKCSSQQKSIAEQLGYPAGTKLLVIHADDIGVAHSENEATINAFESGSISSGSIMVPCAWFPEIAAYAKAHPAVDLGLHLTLTAEWKNYKWGSVSPRTQVASLLDDRGFFYDNGADLATKGKIEEVEHELRNQIERSIQFGIDPTHFDTHMGTMFANIEWAKLYMKLGREYKVPVLINHAAAKAFLNVDLDNYIQPGDVVADNILMAQPDHFKTGMKEFYTGVLKRLQPGLNVLLIHVAHDDAEMKAVTIDHPDYGAAWRQADYDFFTSDECKRIIRDQKIQLITWREIRDKIVRK
jgi:predicted glycoside hydrolase/deacetylase ChbG (UPF0249 family)